MNHELALKRLGKLMTQFPEGTIVWHRADGRRALVYGWELFGNGEVLLRVDFGRGNVSSEMPLAVSRSKLHLDEGEEWKGGGNDDGEAAGAP